METNKTQKLHEIQIETDFNYPRGYLVKVTIPTSGPYGGKPYFRKTHIYNTAAEAGEAIHGLKEFYKYFCFDN